MKAKNFNKELYDVNTVDEDILVKNPEYDPKDYIGRSIGNVDEFIPSGDSKPVIDIDEVLKLKVIGILEHLENRIVNGRIKNDEHEKIKIKQFQTYLKGIEIFTKLQNKPFKADTIDKDKLESVLSFLEE